MCVSARRALTYALSACRFRKWRVAYRCDRRRRSVSAGGVHSALPVALRALARPVGQRSCRAGTRRQEHTPGGMRKDDHDPTPPPDTRRRRDLMFSLLGSRAGRRLPKTLVTPWGAEPPLSSPPVDVLAGCPSLPRSPSDVSAGGRPRGSPGGPRVFVSGYDAGADAVSTCSGPRLSHAPASSLRGAYHQRGPP